MSPSGPLVSVIIPAFNAAPTLAEAVRSVLDGNYRNIEVLIIDDGSTDETAQIAATLVRCDPRVGLHRRPNGGLSAALNSGFALTRGDYVARLDADDLWHPSKLSKQMVLAGDAPDAAFIYTFVRYIDADGRVAHDAPRQHFPTDALCRGLYESLVGGGSSAVMKRSAVAAAGGCDESLTSWEDLLLQLKISARFPVAFVPEYLVGYRIRPGSLTANPANMLRNWRLARQRIGAEFPAIPQLVHAWAHGKRCAHFAEAFAWRGERRRSAALLLEAIRHDPLWTTHWLAYRAERHLRRRFSPREEAGFGPSFLRCDPSEQVHLSDYDLGREGQALRRLDRKRERLLAAWDLSLAGAAASTPRAAGAAGTIPPRRVRP